MMSLAYIKGSAKPYLAIGILFAIISVCLITSDGFTAQHHPEDILIIVNKNVGIETLKISDVKQIFLKRKTFWPGNGPILPINAPADSKLRKDFYKRALGWSASKEKNFWESQKIKGKNNEPPSYHNTYKSVFRLRGSISYAFRKDIVGDLVDVVLVLPKQ